jgi:hypothetical protein
MGNFSLIYIQWNCSKTANVKDVPNPPADARKLALLTPGVGELKGKL